MGGVHVLLGAAVGSLCRSKGSALLAGLASHFVADSIPHRDCSVTLDTAIAAASLAGVALWKGTDSAEFWGGFGGILPDAEHALTELGLITQEQEVFPTHNVKLDMHGPDSGEFVSQVIAGIASILLLALKGTVGIHRGDPGYMQRNASRQRCHASD